MDDSFQARKSGRLCKEGGRQLLAIDAAVRGRAGKRSLDGGDRGTAVVELVYLGVGVADRHTNSSQARRDRALAHADRTGEADDQRLAHDDIAPRRRNSASTGM